MAYRVDTQCTSPGGTTEGHALNIIQTDNVPGYPLYSQYCIVDPQLTGSGSCSSGVKACWLQSKGESPVIPSRFTNAACVPPDYASEAPDVYGLGRTGWSSVYFSWPATAAAQMTAAGINPSTYAGKCGG